LSEKKGWIGARTLWAIKLLVHLGLLGMLAILVLACQGILSIGTTLADICPYVTTAAVLAVVAVVLDGIPATGNHYP
jgi:hypothetical protein